LYGAAGLTREKYTTRLLKSSALLEEMRLLVQNWKYDLPWLEQKQKIILENHLGKKSKKRIINILNSAFYPRFIKGNPSAAWKIIRPLEDNNTPIEVLKPLYYWVSCRNEALLYDYVVEEIFSKRNGGDLTIRPQETILWIKKKLVEYKKEWSQYVIQRIAQGVLTTLRDLGLLEGAVKKKIAPVYIPLEAFAYLAFTLYKLGNSGESLINHTDWQLFLIDSMGVERLLLEAHQNKFLHYASAGKIYRIEFHANNWEEMANVIIGKKH
jgi:hypothetical protein